MHPSSTRHRRRTSRRLALHLVAPSAAAEVRGPSLEVSPGCRSKVGCACPPLVWEAQGPYFRASRRRADPENASAPFWRVSSDELSPILWPAQAKLESIYVTQRCRIKSAIQCHNKSCFLIERFSTIYNFNHQTPPELISTTRSESARKNKQTWLAGRPRPTPPTIQNQ